MNHIERIKRLRGSFTEDFEAMLITNPRNVRYLCGFSGSSGTMLITRDRAVFFTDFRYQEQSAIQVGKTARIVVFKRASLIHCVRKSRNSRLPASESKKV